MKWVLGMVVVGAALVALWAMGYTVHVGEGSAELIGPARVSPCSAEAEANAPECAGLKERLPEPVLADAEASA